jgi:hypothetical protein
MGDLFWKELRLLQHIPQVIRMNGNSTAVVVLAMCKAVGGMVPTLLTETRSAVPIKIVNAHE